MEILMRKKVRMDYEGLAKLFRILGNPRRIQILEMLAHGPVCVNEMIHCTHQRQAYISQQLMLLRSKGLVDAKKDGWSVCYAFLDTPETLWLKRLLVEVCPGIKFPRTKEPATERKDEWSVKF